MSRRLPNMARRSVAILAHRTADVVEPGSYDYMIGNLDTAG